MDTLLKNINVIQVLSLGAIGLGFFLAIFSYRLLSREQDKKEPRPALLRSITLYMAFAIVLVVLGVAGRYIDRPAERQVTADLSVLTDVFARKRAELANDRKPDQFKQGIVTRGEPVSFPVSLLSGECKTFLAMVLPENQLDLTHKVSGAGAADVTFQISSGVNFATGEMCAGVKPASVELFLSAKSGSSPFIAETYFSLRRLLGSDGKFTSEEIVAVETLQHVRPENYDANKKFFVEVFADQPNRGLAARVMVLLEEHGFEVGQHFEEGANMVGWEGRGNGIVAGDETFEKAHEIQALLKPLIAESRLTIAKSGARVELPTMGKNTLAIFLSKKN
jgi:hypothetical protein